MHALAMFLTNLGWVAGLVLFFAACGWWAVAPFRGTFVYPLAQAPLAGMLALSLGSLLAVVPLNLSVQQAMGLVAAVCVGASLLSWPSGEGRRLTGSLPFLSAMALAAAAAAVWFVTRTDLFFGAPGLLYSHGTDHLGYALVADWMKAHAHNPTATADPGDWYGSFAQLQYAWEPRFGAFLLFAAISVVSSRSGAFAYDLACAVVLAAAVLGVSGVYARRRLTFAALAVGLFTSAWFDLSRTGYFGRLTGYPATLFTVGLFFAWPSRVAAGKPFPLTGLVTLSGLVAGAALAHHGLVTGTILMLVGGLFILARIAMQGTGGVRSALGREQFAAAGLALLVGVAVLATARIAGPRTERFPFPWSWTELLPRAIEVEGLISNPLQIAPGGLLAAELGMFAVLLGFALLAWRWRRPEAAALLLGPAALLALFAAGSLRWHAAVMIGTFFPAFLCGAAELVDGMAGAARRWKLAVLVGLGTVLALHVPRFVRAAAYYGGAKTPPQFRFSSAESEALASTVARAGGALVDAGDVPQFNIFLLAELGRRNIPLQWSERSWKYVLGYRPWPAPYYPKPAGLRIVQRSEANSGLPTLLLRTTQFDVLRDQ